MGVDDGRRQTAGQRRGLIIEALSRELDWTNEASTSFRLDSLLKEPARHLIVSGDIDGLVSASMLAAAAPAGWRAVALIAKSGEVLLHPDFADGLDLSDCFG